MPFVDAIGYGTLVGLSLGLTGGGGAIFAVPLLVYGVGLDFRAAVALSLATVGTTALYGALLGARRGSVLWGAGLVLGASGAMSAPFGAIIGTQLSERVSLLLFSAVMLVVAARMLRSASQMPAGGMSWIACDGTAQGQIPAFTLRCASKLAAAGCLTGVLSGIFGVGGGFLLVPALTAVLSLQMMTATATSLVAIVLISASGFVANLGKVAAEDTIPGLCFLFGALLGMSVAAPIRSRVSDKALRRVFGVMVLVAVAVVVARNVAG